MLPQQITFPIIGIVNSPLKQKFGTPRQPNLVDINATISMLPPYNVLSAFEGIAQFSHLWIIWQFHQNRINPNPSNFQPTVRPPRLGGNQKIGVFASRSMYRPANIGLSVVKFSHIENSEAGLRLHIFGADMIDGTPVIDIKPYLPYSDSIDDAIAGYASQKPIIKSVHWHPDLLQDLSNIAVKSQLKQTDWQTIEQLIAQDPRPAYRQQALNTIFVMRYQNVDVHFSQIADSVLQIQAIELLN